jgi:hypothetical protein
MPMPALVSSMPMPSYGYFPCPTPQLASLLGTVIEREIIWENGLQTRLTTNIDKEIAF